MMIVSAKPNAKPLNTGREINPVKFPNRNRLAIRNSIPANKTARVAFAAFSKAVPGKEASVAARIAAEDEVGATIAKRLCPTAAYARHPTIPAITALVGSNPAIAE